MRKSVTISETDQGCFKSPDICRGLFIFFLLSLFVSNMMAQQVPIKEDIKV